MANRHRGINDSSPAGTTIPLWLSDEPGEFAAYQRLDLVEFHCRLGIFPAWLPRVETAASKLESQHIYHGDAATDWLVVSHMPRAVPGHNMLNWVDVPLSLLAFPSVEIATRSDPTPTLITWKVQPTCEACCQKLMLDELHLITGLARFASGLARLHVLLSRRGQLAWKVFLSFNTAAGSGNEIACLHEDHRRAAAVFSHLSFDQGNAT